MTVRKLYLNHAGTSWPKPRAVTEAVRDAMLVEPTQWPQRFAEAHQAIAEFFGVHQPEQILLTPGCTSSLAVGIGDALIPSGKRVLTSRWEHHALHRPLLKRGSSGVQIDYIPPWRNADAGRQIQSIDLDWLENALSNQDVALVAITAACNVTGELLPFDDVIRMARRHGARVLIDAAQVVGWLKLDLPRLGADVVAFGGHKGLQGPWGVGGLYVSESMQMECASATCEVPVEGESEDRRPPRPGYCDVGSVDQFALAGLHAAIKMLGKQDLDANLTTARGQIQRIRAVLQQSEDLQIFDGATNGMPSLAVGISGVPSGEIASHLAQHGLIVGSGIHCAPLAHETLGTQDTGLVRLSVGVGQPEEEIDEAIDRLRSAFQEGPFRAAGADL